MNLTFETKKTTRNTRVNTSRNELTIKAYRIEAYKKENLLVNYPAMWV